MEDSLITIFSIILAVLLMFIFPLMDTWERQDDRNLWFVRSDMYYSFLRSVYSTGNRYQITLEHRNFELVPGFESGVYVNTYTNSIINKLNTTGRYDMEAGDYFYVSVKNTNKTQATQIQEVIYASTQETFKIGVPYGGMVRNTSSKK